MYIRIITAQQQVIKIKAKAPKFLQVTSHKAFPTLPLKLTSPNHRPHCQPHYHLPYSPPHHADPLWCNSEITWLEVIFAPSADYHVAITVCEENVELELC